MSDIVNFFFTEIVNSCNLEGLYVDISSLIEFCNQMSPKRAVYKYSDAEKSLKCLKISIGPTECPTNIRLIDAASVIISNLCLKFCKQKFFPKSGLQILAEIFQKNSEDENVCAQLTLLIHASKSDLNIDECSDFIEDIAKMVVVKELNEQMVKWQSAAQSVLNHIQLNEIIDDSINEYGYDYANIGLRIEIVFISMTLDDLRGFGGINKVYINADHFIGKSVNYEIDPNWLNDLIELDMMTITLHEFGHVKFRKAVDDFNMSSPFSAKTKQLKRSHYEFGRLIETKVFGAAIDWVKSNKRMSKAYVVSTIEAIKSNKHLPDCKGLKGVIRRGPPLLLAVDYNLKRDFF